MGLLADPPWDRLPHRKQTHLGNKALSLLITILASVVMNRLLSRGPLGIGSVPVCVCGVCCVLCGVWYVCVSAYLSLCLSVYVSVCLCVPSWPRVIFRIVTLHLGEGGLELLGSVKVQILDNSI